MKVDESLKEPLKEEPVNSSKPEFKVRKSKQIPIIQNQLNVLTESHKNNLIKHPDNPQPLINFGKIII